MQANKQSSYDNLFREVVDAFPDGLGLFDADACLVHSNHLLSELNPAISDLLKPGLEWDAMLREMVARGAIDTQARDRLGNLEARLDSQLEARLVVEIRDLGLHEFVLTATERGGFILMQRDVTRRETEDEQERDADALLRQVMEACSANLVMSRMDDGQIIYRSPAARELLGSARKVNEHFVRRSDQADLLTALLPEGWVNDVSVTLKAADGQEFPALISSRIIEYRGEDVTVSSLVDITKEVGMRKMLAAQRERIFEVEKLSALGELLAGVAHELNNPLSVVVGHALMMREETSDPEILRRVEQIAAAAERCTKIVKSFLAMAREQNIEKKPLSCAEILGGARRSLEEAGHGSRLSIEVDLQDDMPNICGDGSLLEQVFMNLLINAEQALAMDGRDCKVVISANVDIKRHLMQIDVKDNGPGISRHLERKVFEPLFTTKEVGQGTGIGLAFCHRVLSAHGGSIELVRSKSGAHFRIHLPLEETSPKPAKADREGANRENRGHVLVIDDEEDVASLIAEILRRDGFTVEAVYSGEAGVKAVLSKRFDAILADIKMPGIGGQGFLKEIKRLQPETADRIAFVTGSTMSPDIRGFLDNCNARFLEKPVAPSEVRSLARELVERSMSNG